MILTEDRYLPTVYFIAAAIEAIPNKKNSTEYSKFSFPKDT